MRFLCPVYENARSSHASRAGLSVVETWWLRELPGVGGGAPGVGVALPGADALTVAAPPVYAPPGPVLFLPAPTDAATALPAAVARAPELGCAAVVVTQEAGDEELGRALEGESLRPQCAYYEGELRMT